MKYIRTKDGRIIDTATLPPLVKEAKYDGEGIGEYHGIPIVAEADTIKELCDCLMVNGLCDPFFESWDYVLNDDDRRNYDVYGAIFTDEGIKYVAKLNEEGELELL